jgi:hypothetical protein
MKPLAIAFIGMLVACKAAGAESALQQFQRTIPARVQYEFAVYQACALTAAVDAKRAGKTFEQTEADIAGQCRRYVAEADRNMAAAGTSAEDRARIIETFGRLALEERRLTYEGKPVPRYEPDAWTKKATACLDTGKVYEAINACVRSEARPLITHSQEQPEDIATAVLSSCQKPIAELKSQLVPCTGIQGSETAVAPYLKALRDSLVTAVVKDRAARGSGVQP